jgi:sulfatase maturation enzyme AslB (radical SAM superfamily)
MPWWCTTRSTISMACSIDRVQRIEDLYRVRMDERGQWVRVPVLAMGMTLGGS